MLELPRLIPELLLPELLTKIANEQIQDVVDYIRPILKPIYTLQDHIDRVNFVTFSPDDTKIATASHDGNAKIWDAQTGQLLRTLQNHTIQAKTTHEGPVSSAVFSPDGTKIVTASHDGNAKIWNTQTGDLIQTLQDPATPENTTHTSLVAFVTFRPYDTTTIVTAGDKTVKIWGFQTQRKEQAFAWLKYNLSIQQAQVIILAYEQKLAGQRLTLTGEDLVTFNTMPEHVRSLLIDYLDIIVPQ